jgi:hypothetical protein
MHALKIDAHAASELRNEADKRLKTETRNNVI